MITQVFAGIGVLAVVGLIGMIIVAIRAPTIEDPKPRIKWKQPK